MLYLENEDVYICKNGKRLMRAKEQVRKYESGFVDTIYSYRCFECMGCPYNNQCIKSKKAEGMFSKLKDGLKYDRFRHRGMKGVISDITLMAIGINLNKLHSKMIKDQTGVIEYKKVA